VRVSVKDFNVSMELGNNGMELDVYDNNGQHLGDLRVGKAKIEWCRGRTRTGNGKIVTWQQLIGWFESLE
jgi:hypothetical protein